MNKLNLTPDIGVPLAKDLSGVRSYDGIYCFIDSSHSANAVCGWIGGDICHFCFVCEKCKVEIRYSEHVPEESRWNPSGFQREFERSAYMQLTSHAHLFRKKFNIPKRPHPRPPPLKRVK